MAPEKIANNYCFCIGFPTHAGFVKIEMHGLFQQHYYILGGVMLTYENVNRM